MPMCQACLDSKTVSIVTISDELWVLGVGLCWTAGSLPTLRYPRIYIILPALWNHWTWNPHLADRI